MKITTEKGTSNLNNDNYEPTEEDIQYLNELDQGYVGITKPKVIYERFKSNLITKQQALEEDGDYFPSDLQGWE